MLFSFPIGAYLFFSSQIGKSIDFNLPLSEVSFLRNFNTDLLSIITIGDVFVVVWSFYLILFTISFAGPSRSLIKTLSSLMYATPEAPDGNYLVQTIRWFCVIILLSEAIDMIQGFFGITIRLPAFENDLVQYLGVAFSPFYEEVIFRVVLVGVPLYLFYSRRISPRLFASSLWMPSRLPIANFKKPLVLVVAVGILFGAAHVFSEQWGVGKFSQATISGIIIGWVYVRYGFVPAVLIHWATNYFIFTYGYLVASVNEVNFAEAFSSSLIQTLEILFVTAGILSIVMMLFHHKQQKIRA